ncbi:PRD domain-containing protein [Salmonella enterica]|nr:PRD domain-containing protein [Salmonella enterica]ECC3883102.1 PRD domain-containing protein [Salmonella enterica subsp. diarizonae]ECN5336794.1 PRD domain-containing protein [Salmonella enterica subsp. enterica serovar Give]EFO9811962.1 PRD domain-containing protein [Salmonella enterica subsp. enterica serovar Enteritidis]EIE2751308.1 PRD domain-containing protein [Salmonella enterica subsp. diarizonae serovar 48:i:z]
MEKRLNLLCDAGIIDRDIRDGMLEMIKMLETVYGIPVRNEQGEMALTHMANALMRSRNGEEIAPLDDELLKEITSSAEWPQLSLIHQAMLASFDVTLHPNEEGYLMANLFSLWMGRLNFSGITS